MFRGIHSLTLDAAGCITIPERYRAELLLRCDRQIVVTIAVDEKGAYEAGCLWLYPSVEWDEVEKKIAQLPSLNEVAKKVRRFLVGYATDCRMDNQGRLVLPKTLRQFAGMEERIVLVGQLNHFEIWNESYWQAKEREWLEGVGKSNGIEALASLSF